MKKIIVVCFLIVAAGNCLGQQVTFQKTYGGPYNDQGFSVQQTTDGGYIIAGSKFTSSNNVGDIYLVKTDSYGDTLWTRVFGGPSTDVAQSIQQTADGGFIIGGTTYSFGAGYADFCLIKTDTNGNPLWRKTFGGTDDDFGYSVRQTTDGGYIMTGLTTSFGLNNSGVYLIRTDGNGDSLWTKIFSATGYEAGYDVMQTTDGGYIVTGRTSNVILGYYDVYLIKTDTAGNPLWTKALGGNTSDIGYSVQQTFDGGYIVAGYTSNFGAGVINVYLIRTDGNGDTLWSKTFGGTAIDYGYFVRQTADGGFIIVGYTSSFGAGNSDIYVVRADTNGNPLWSKTYGGSGYDYGNSVQQTSDGGYIIIGTALGFGSGNNDLYLIKTDPNGNSGCNEGNPATIVTSPATQAISLSTPVFSDGTVTNWTANVTSKGTITTLCFTVGIPSVSVPSQSEISISPNPATNNFTITFPNTINKGMIEIYNVLGKKIFSENVFNVTQKEIHIKNINAGIYFVKVKDGEKEFSKKLVIE